MVYMGDGVKVGIYGDFVADTFALAER